MQWATHKFKMLILSPNEDLNQHHISLPILPSHTVHYVSHRQYVLPVAKKGQSKVTAFIDEKTNTYRQKFVELPITVLTGTKSEFLKIDWTQLKQAMVFCLGTPKENNSTLLDQFKKTFVILIISLKDFSLFKAIPLTTTVDQKYKSIYLEDFRRKFKYSTNLAPYTYFIVNDSSIIKPMVHYCSGCKNFFEKFLINGCELFLYDCITELKPSADTDLSWLEKVGTKEPLSNIVAFNPYNYDLSFPLVEIEKKAQQELFAQRVKARQHSYKLRRYCCSYCDFYIDKVFTCKYQSQQFECNGPYQIFHEPWEVVAKRLFKPWELHVFTLFNRKLPEKKALKAFPELKKHLLKHPAIVKFPLRSLNKLTLYTLYEVDKAKDQFVLLLANKEIIILPYEEFCKKFGYKLVDDYEKVLKSFYKSLKPYLQKDTEDRILITVLMNLKFELKDFKTGRLLFRSRKKYKPRYDFLEKSLIQFYGLENLFTRLRNDLMSDPLKEKHKIKRRVIFQDFKPKKEDYFRRSCY